MSNPLYIFDLDGTLADISHRRHLVENGNREWDAFYAACVDDKPNVNVIQLFNTLANDIDGYENWANELWVWSGRSSVVRYESNLWLGKYTGFSKGSSITEFRMRPDGDFTPDDQLKEKWLNEMSPKDRERLVLVVDDRKKVVDMWRRNGVTCLQCAEGDF